MEPIKDSLFEKFEKDVINITNVMGGTNKTYTATEKITASANGGDTESDTSTSYDSTFRAGASLSAKVN